MGKPLASKVSAYLEDAKEFVPFKLKDKETAELINKNNIKTVEWEEDGSRGGRTHDTSHKQEVTITFIDNDTITGTLVSDTPRERSRLSDCLNTKEGFIHITDGKRHIHVNKSMLLRVPAHRGHLPNTHFFCSELTRAAPFFAPLNPNYHNAGNLKEILSIEAFFL